MTRAAVPLLTLSLLCACAEQEEAFESEVPEQSGDAGIAATASPVADARVEGAPTDAQIAAIVLSANSADSATGELANRMATDARVKEFARRMVADHGAVNQQAVALAGRLGVTPEGSATSESLRQDGEQTMNTLQGLSGAAFDRAYITHEVTLHQQVLDALDQTLIPSAQNAELKDLLERGRPIFQGHLEMAKQIESSLGGV